MYEAKQHGRNRVMHSRSNSGLRSRVDLETADH
jgi:hypothetical protein